MISKSQSVRIRTRTMRILLASHGTRGDVQPILALAVALRARGHVVLLTVSWELRVVGSELRVRHRIGWYRCRGPFAICGQQPAIIELANAVPVAHHAARLRAVARTSEGCELVIGAGLQFAAASVAEWRGVPYAHAVFCPCATPSNAVPPPNVHRQTLPRWFNRLLWKVVVLSPIFALRGHINRGRATLGLKCSTAR